MADVRLPSGKIISNVPDDITQTELMDIAIKNGLAKPEDFGITKQEPSFTDKAIGGLETLGTIASGSIAQPLSGLAGLAAGGLEAMGVPNMPNQAAAKAVEAVQSGMTYQPKTQQGQENLQAINNSLLGDFGRGMKKAEEYAGELGYEQGGPFGGALASTIPTLATELATFGMGKGASSLTRKAAGMEVPSPVTLERQAVVEAGKQADIPIMTTDVFPPETWAGKAMQSLSEKLGVLGTGGTRAKQQAAREAAVAGMADELGIEIDSPFAETMVKSLNAKNAKVMEQAGAQRARAEAILDPAGQIRPSKALAEIDKILGEQKRLGKNSNPKITEPLKNLRDELARNPSFSLAREHRSKIIKDVIAAGRGEDVSPAAALSQVKQALDKDMIAFANKVDKNAAKDWLHSNRKMAEELQLVKETELKRVLEGGEATPEVIMPILTGGKPSQLQRVYNALGAKGRDAAKKAIIQDALKKSGYFADGDAAKSIKFQNALNTPSMINATKVFFPGVEGKELRGLMLALEKTRSAQTGQQFAKTGEAVVPSAVAGGVVGKIAYDPASAMATLSGVALASGALKAYESPAFRNMLIRLANVDPKSAAYNTLVGEVSAAISGAAAQEVKQQSNQQNEMLDPQSMIQQQAMDDANMIVDNFGNDLVKTYGVKANPRISGIDLFEVTSHPKEVGMALLGEVYQEKAGYIPVAENYIELAIGKPEYERQIEVVGNILQNSGIIPPDDKEEFIARSVSLGVKPEKAFEIANTIKQVSKKEAKKIAEAIRAKILPEQYQDFAPLLQSIEALA